MSDKKNEENYTYSAIQQREWFLGIFTSWAQKLRCGQIVLVPGNHDYCFEKYGCISPEEKILILNNQGGRY